MTAPAGSPPALPPRRAGTTSCRRREHRSGAATPARLLCARRQPDELLRPVGNDLNLSRPPCIGDNDGKNPLAVGSHVIRAGIIVRIREERLGEQRAWRIEREASPGARHNAANLVV